MYWTCDFKTKELPSRLKKNGTEYNLQITSGAFPYILNYSGYAYYEDRPTIAIQACGKTMEEAVSKMVQELRSLGFVWKQTISKNLRSTTLYDALLNNLRSQPKIDEVMGCHPDKVDVILAKNEEIKQYPDEPTPELIEKIANDPVIWNLYEEGPHPIYTPKGAWTVRDILGTLQQRCRKSINN